MLKLAAALLLGFTLTTARAQKPAGQHELNLVRQLTGPGDAHTGAVSGSLTVPGMIH